VTDRTFDVLMVLTFGMLPAVALSFVAGCATVRSGASCYHDYTLKCTCAPNQCQVLP
jgi:hypothetical protein